MSTFTLERGEFAITESKDVTWVSYKNMVISLLLLTNMNIYMAYHEKESFFSKPKPKVKKLPLESISIKHGEVMADIVKTSSGCNLHIQHAHGNDIFSFPTGESRTIEWANEIVSAVIQRNNDLLAYEEVYSEESYGIDEPDIPTASFTPLSQTRVTKQCIGCGAPLTGYEGDTVICEYCDIEQVL